MGKVKKKYWIYTTITECSVCGKSFKAKDAYKKPKDPRVRQVFCTEYDYCMEQ